MVDKIPIRAMLTIIEATDPQPVEGKNYKKMSVKATTDMTGDESFVFVTFYPSVMDVMKRSIGKTVECNVLLGEKKIVGIVEESANGKEISYQAQSTMRAVADMSLSETITIPQDILDNNWELIRKWQKEALR